MATCLTMDRATTCIVSIRFLQQRVDRKQEKQLYVKHFYIFRETDENLFKNYIVDECD